MTGAKTYTGGTTITGGVLNVGDGSALGTGTLAFTSSAILQAGAAGLTTSNNTALQGTLTVNTKGNDYTLAGTLQDLTTTGTLLKAGAGRLTLSGINGYTGGTRVEGGSVAISADAGLGAGTGTLTLAGGGLALTGGNGVGMTRGVVLSGAGGSISVDDFYGVLSLNGPISGNGSLTKLGLGKLDLDTANSYSGGTIVNGGSLDVGAAGALGTGQVTVGNSVLGAVADGLSFGNPVTLYNAAINTNGHNLTLTGPVGGTSVTVYGSGTLTLTGNNTIGSGITVATGTIAVGSNTALGPNILGLFGGTSLIAAADNLVLDNYYQFGGAPITIDTRAATLTLNGQINQSGSGVTINKAGSGTLIVNGDWNSDHAGIDNVVAGTLQVQTGRTIYAGQLNVGSGATLSGTGSVLSPDASTTVVTVAPGGKLSPGTTAPGTLTLDNLTLTAGSLLNFKLGKAGAVGGANNDLVIVNGQLTLAGTLNVANGPFFSKGQYTLFTYGMVTDNGLVLGTLPSGYTGTVAVITNDGGPGGMVVLEALGTGRQYWDGAGALADHIVSGGSGIWNSGSFNWASVDGASNFVWNNQQAVFGTAGDNVTVAGAQQFTLLEFDVDGYHLSGTSLAATSQDGVAAPEINTATATTTIIDNVLTGTSGLLKSGLGTLTLNGNNTLTGTVLVGGGRLVAGSSTAFGSGAVELFDGSALGAGAALALANNFILNGVATVDSSGFAVTLNGVIDGFGRLAIVDSGSPALAGLITLNGVNTYFGDTTIANARVSVAADSALGDAANGLGLSGGSLLTSASFSSARVVTLAGDSSFVPVGGTTLTLNGNIGGSGSLRQAGAGTLVLGGANSYAGGTFVNAGILSISADANLGGSGGGLGLLGATLQLTGDVTGSRPVAIAGANTIDTGAFTLTLDGPVTSTGTLTKTGAGTLVLNGANSSVAPTALVQGTIQAGSDSAIGGGGLTMSDGTTLAGFGKVALPDAVTIAGVATIDSGSGLLRLNGIVGGTGSVIKQGTGTLQLFGTNSFNGLNIVTGSVLLGSNAAAGNGAIMLGNATLLTAVDGVVAANAITTVGTGILALASGTFTLDGIVSGPGQIIKLGAGTVVLNGVNSFGAAGLTGLTIGGGTAVLGTNSAAGPGTMTLASGATLAVATSGLVFANTVVTQGGNVDSGAGAFTLGGPVTGAGGLTKLGSGTLTLAGKNSYTGATSVTSGTLAVNGANSGGGAVGVLAGATLTGSGSIAGVVSIANGATLAPGNGVGTLTTGGLVLGTSATLAYQLGQANVVGGPSNDLLQVNGGLTLGGKLNVADSGGFGTGVYRLINYTGALANNGLAVNSLPGFYTGQIQTAVPGTVNVLITTPNVLVQYWDGADMAGNGVIDGGSGSWTAANSNWTTPAPSTINSSWAGGVAVFGSTAGTVTVTGTQAFQGLQFTTPGYVLTGGALNASAGSFIATSGGTTTIASTLTGGGVTKQGAGTLALTGGNSFAALNIMTGTVSLGANSAGGAGNIALADGTTLAAGAAGLQLANTISTAGIGTIDTGANNLELDRTVSGPGSLTKLGTGTLTFFVEGSSFTDLHVNAGTVSTSTHPVGAGNLGTGTIFLTDGTTLAGGLQSNGLFNPIVVTGAVRIDSGNTIAGFTNQFGRLFLGGDISGSGSITKVSTGLLTLSGNNSFNGLTIAGGTVSVGGQNNAGVGAIALANGTTFDSSGSYSNAFSVSGIGNLTGGPTTLNGIVSGPGSIKSTGALTLNGVNSFTGLTIGSGSVTLGNSSAGGNGSIALGFNTTLRAGAAALVVANAISLGGTDTVDTQGFTTTLSGPITGGSVLIKTGSGTLILNNANSYSAGTQLNAGQIIAGSSTALGSGALTTTAGTRLGAGISGLTLANAINEYGTLTVDSGSGVLTLAGQIQGPGAITKTGSGNLVLTANNGGLGITIAAGRLTLGSNTSAGNAPIALADGTTLAAGLPGLVLANAVSTAGAGTFDVGAGVLTLAGPVTGAGSVAKTGAGNLILTGSNSYAGATSVAAGTLTVNSLNSGTGAVAVQSGAALTGSGSIAGAVSVASGATLSPGSGVGTLTMGGLALSSGATLTYQLGQANVIGGSFNDLLQVNGNLTLGGGLTVTNSGNFGSGVYRLINYTGALTNNGLVMTSLPGGSSGQVQTAIGGTVNLLVTAPNALVQYWDGADAAGNGRIDGGSGSWTAAATNWTSAAPSTINSSWGVGVGVFSGTAGTVAVTGTQAFQGLQFASPGYVLTGGTLAAAPGAFIAMDGGTTTIASTITGAGTGSSALSKQGAGVLVLTGSNSFGGLSIAGGSVMLGSSTAGGTGTIALGDGTTLAAGVDGLILANVVTTAGAGTFDAGAGTFTLNGAVNGPGSIAKAGSGNLVLAGANSFNGLSVNAGSVTLGTNTAGGSGVIALADGTALVAGTGGLQINNAITTAGSGTINSGAALLVLGSFHTGSGSITGPGSITKAGSGQLELLGTNSFTGLTISSGTVVLGNNHAAGNGTIALADATTLAVDGFSTTALANNVTTAGVGTINSGQFALALNGTISGPGSISKTGSGNLVLNGSNSFNGFAVNAGTVTVGTSSAAGSGAVALADGTTLASGATGLVLTTPVSTAGAGTLDSGAGVFTLAGPVTGPGSIAKAGAGNLVLNGSNSFTGLGVTAGTVTADNNTAAGTGVIALAGGTTLVAGAAGLKLVNAVTIAGIGTVNTNGFDLTLGGPITGPGSLVYSGGGSLAVSGVDSYAGPTTVAAGQLRVTGSLTSSTVTLASGASLRGTGSVAGLVASSGSTVAPGLGTATGTLLVTGNAVFQPGSTFAVNVSVPTADRLSVGGTASLAGTLAISQLAGPLVPATTYTLLSAAGGRSGTFGTVSYSNITYNAAFAPAVSYTANSVLLGLQPRSLLGQAGGGLTPNERNVAAAYDAATAAGFVPTAFAALFAPGLNLPDALNQLSGEVHSAERRVAMDDTRHVREAALDRLGGGLAATPGKDDSAATSEHGGHSYTLWARGVGAWGTNRSDGNGSAFNTSTGGAIVGIDIGFDGGKIGALFDYTTTTLDHYALGQSKVESTGGGIYAGYRREHGFAAAAGASIAGIKARSSRSITVPGLGQNLAARSDGNTYQAFADVSYDLASGTSRVEPFLRFAWVALDTAAFTETGGSAALTASRGAYTTDVATAGLRGAIDLKGFTLRASAGAQHTGGDRSPAALLALAGSNSPASISAVPVDRWALAADLSGEFRLGRNATFAVGYSGVNGDRTRDNGVRGTLTLGF